MFKKILLFLIVSVAFISFSQSGLDVDSNAVNEIVSVVEEVPSTEAVAAKEIKELGLDEKIDKQFGKATGWFVTGIFWSIPFSETLQIPWVLIVLILGALYFTIYFKFINIRGFKTSINIVRGKYDDY